MRIAIIEVDYHPEVLRNTIILFNELKITCVVFTLKEIWRKVGKLTNSKYLITHIIDNKKSINTYIRNHLEIINNCNFIFFNTCASKYKLFSDLDYTPPVILRVHNANAFFKPYESLNFELSLFYIFKAISYITLHVIFKLELFYRNKFLQKKVTFFCFLDEQVTKYIKSNNYLSENKIISSIPFAFSKPIFKIKVPNKPVVISIIGGIDKRRRNYAEVYKAFKQLLHKKTYIIELRLLGPPVGIYGKTIINKFRKLENPNFKLLWFNSYISQSIFEEYVRTTHFLIIPVYKEVRYKIFKELSGYTKISGSINDMIIYRKPAIIPDFYPIPDEFKSIVKKYNNIEGLQICVKNFIETGGYLQTEHDRIFNGFDLKSMAQKAETSLSQISQRL